MVAVAQSNTVEVFAGLDASSLRAFLSGGSAVDANMKRGPTSRLA